MTLTLNGKKKKLKIGDFKAAFSTLLLEEKQQENIFRKMEKHKSGWLELIDNSFLSDEFKHQDGCFL